MFWETFPQCCIERHRLVTALRRRRSCYGVTAGSACGTCSWGLLGTGIPSIRCTRSSRASSQGDPLQVRMGTDRWELLADNGMVVGQLARNFTAPVDATGGVRATVMAIVSWDAERSEPEYRQGLRSEAWEVVVPELVLE